MSRDLLSIDPDFSLDTAVSFAQYKTEELGIFMSKRGASVVPRKACADVRRGTAAARRENDDMQFFLNRHPWNGLVISSATFATLSIGLLAAGPAQSASPPGVLVAQLLATSLLVAAVLSLIAAFVLARRHLHKYQHLLAEEARHQSTDERLAAIFHSVPVAIMVVRLADGHIVEVNSAFSELWGYTRQEACGRTSTELNLWIEPKQLIQQLKANRHADAQEFQVRCKSGEARDALVSVALIHVEGAAHLLITAADVTDRRQAKEMLHIAQHDTLTALPNRRWLLTELQTMQRDDMQQGVHALLFIDLDRFKAVNDRLGHQAGDELLRLAAQRMKSRLRTTDALVRLGGDEFIALLTGLASADDAERIADEILEIIATPFSLAGGEEARIGASIGISLVTSDTDVETLIHRADTALYAAKAAGRNTVRVFDAVTPRCDEARVTDGERQPS